MRSSSSLLPTLSFASSFATFALVESLKFVVVERLFALQSVIQSLATAPHQAEMRHEHQQICGTYLVSPFAIVEEWKYAF